MHTLFIHMHTVFNTPQQYDSRIQIMTQYTNALNATLFIAIHSRSYFTSNPILAPLQHGVVNYTKHYTKHYTLLHNNPISITAAFTTAPC